MQQAEIYDGNRIIADYMKIEKSFWHNMYIYLLPSESGVGKIPSRLDAMKYHNSWDWLIPVIEKIRIEQGIPTLSKTMAELEMVCDSSEENFCLKYWNLVVVYLKSKGYGESKLRQTWI